MTLKKIRIILGFSVLMVSFQNCSGPSTASTPDGTTGGSKASSSVTVGTGTSGSKSGSGLNSGSARSITGGSSSASNGSGNFGGINGGSAGSIGGGTSGSGSGTGTCLGCGSGSGGSTGSGGTGGIGSVDTTFKIKTQPISKTLNEGTEFFVGVTISGGRAPYTFDWYRDGEKLPPKYGSVHYETYSDVVDRIYKEGDYYVIVTDGSGTKLTSSKASIRMAAKLCGRGNYFIDLSVRTNTNDGYTYFNDLFYRGNMKWLVSQNNPAIGMMQLQNFISQIGRLGFGYFTLGGDVSNNQNFSIACSTDVPTVHTSECATNNTSKCHYYRDEGYTNKTYEGSINFLCRNGYIQFVSNTCKLVTPPPLPDNGGGG